ncbi:hypothetical protein glysoja_044062 [Glycine soja]|uniref:Uncharacterized protein n=1 Tax=Glycine soja TaxID=3848 RepID=A0A0B2QNT9_GLYSO|nr:hypothetical protein glysoja_044062 [Glycine soja]
MASTSSLSGMSTKPSFKPSSPHTCLHCPKKLQTNAQLIRGVLTWMLEATKEQIGHSLDLSLHAFHYTLKHVLLDVMEAQKKHWLANNTLGLAFCIQGIEMLSLGSFKTGAILL